MTLPSPMLCCRCCSSGDYACPSCGSLDLLSDHHSACAATVSAVRPARVASHARTSCNLHPARSSCRRRQCHAVSSLLASRLAAGSVLSQLPSTRAASIAARQPRLAQWDAACACRGRASWADALRAIARRAPNSHTKSPGVCAEKLVRPSPATCLPGKCRPISSGRPTY